MELFFGILFLIVLFVTIIVTAVKTSSLLRVAEAMADLLKKNLDAQRATALKIEELLKKEKAEIPLSDEKETVEAKKVEPLPWPTCETEEADKNHCIISEPISAYAPPVSTETPIVPSVPTPEVSIASEPIKAETLPQALPIENDILPDEELNGRATLSGEMQEAIIGTSKFAAIAEPKVATKPEVRKVVPPPKPKELTQTQRYIKDVWHRCWRWFVYGKEVIPEGQSVETLVATTWLMRVATILTLIFVGWLVKVTQLDTYFTGGAGRTIFAYLIGGGLIFFGIRKIKGDFNVLGQGLAGAGIGALFFAVYSTMNFGFIPSYWLCLVLILAVSVTGAIIAVRFDALFMALVAILGGYMAPCFNLPEGNLKIALLIYLALLNVAICVVATHKRWPILNLLSILGTMTTYFIMIISADFQHTPRQDVLHDVPFLLLYATIFSMPPLISTWLKREKTSAFDIVNLILGVALPTFVATGHLVDLKSVEWGAIAPAVMAAVLLLSLGAAYFYRKIDAPLYATWFALIAVMLSAIPPLLFDAQWFIASWAVMSVAFFYLGCKTDSRVLQSVGFTVLGITMVTVIPQGFGKLLIALSKTEVHFWTPILNSVFSIGIPMLACWGFNRFLQRPPVPFDDFKSETMTPVPVWFKGIAYAMTGIGLLGFFIHANITVYFFFHLYYPDATGAGLFCTWVVFALLLINAVKIPLQYIFSPILIIFLIKLAFDFYQWHFNFFGPDYAYDSFVCIIKDGSGRHDIEWGTLLIRFVEIGVAIAYLWHCLTIFKKKDSEEFRPFCIVCCISTSVLLWAWASMEVSTLLHTFVPAIQAIGVTSLWSLFALFFVNRGLTLKNRTMRYTGLVIFGIITLKILANDVWKANGFERLIPLGILVALFIYATIRYIRENAPPKKEDKA